MTNKLRNVFLTRSDKFNGEYVAEHDQWLWHTTGFSGSAGYAILSADCLLAAGYTKPHHIFVDGRYTIQVRHEVDVDQFHIHSISDLAKILSLITADQQQRIIYDPWHITKSKFDHLTAISLATSWVAISTEEQNALWPQRPQGRDYPVYQFSDGNAGSDASTVIKMRQFIAKSQYQENLILLTDPYAISWLLNIRGKGIPYTPAVPYYCLMELSDSNNANKLSQQYQTIKLAEHQYAHYQLYGYEQANTFTQLLNFLRDSGHDVSTDQSSTPVVFFNELANITHAHNVITDLKNIKSDFEQSNIRNAHKRDGVAITDFLNLDVMAGKTELELEQNLLARRQQDDSFIMPSFRTISASGSNGAIVHYGANETSKRILQGGELYLVDSGGHYQDGTTDITRTIYIANEANPKPKDIYIEDYTLVLKAHIAIAMAIFPKQSTGMQIDAIARNILWQYGRDYHHGTGHGIGYALSVHEGDVSISPRCHQPLQSGMLLSNEPGLYVEDSHGIRLENNVLVQKHPNYDGYLCFETISYIKFDDRLIAHSLLTKAEQKWLEQYHANCP